MQFPILLTDGELPASHACFVSKERKENAAWNSAYAFYNLTFESSNEQIVDSMNCLRLVGA